jgi:hypothetical protein
VECHAALAKQVPCANLGRIIHKRGLGWLLYYRHLRNEGRPTIDYGWWGTFLGMRLTTRWSSGAMLDQIETLHNSNTGRFSYYRWIGPYVGFALPEFNGQVRVFGGWDLSKTNGYTDFYKVTYSIAFSK